MECLTKLGDLNLTVHYSGEVFCKDSNRPDEGFSLNYHTGLIYNDGELVESPSITGCKLPCVKSKTKTKYTLFYDSSRSKLYIVFLSKCNPKKVHKFESLVTVWNEFKIVSGDSVYIRKNGKWVYCPPSSGGGGSDIYCVETCGIEFSEGRIPYGSTISRDYFRLFYDDNDNVGNIDTYDIDAEGESRFRVSVIKPEDNIEVPGFYAIIFYHGFARYLRDYINNMSSPKNSLRVYFSTDQLYQLNILKPGKNFMSLILTKESLDTMQYIVRTPTFTVPQQPPYAATHEALRFDVSYFRDNSDTILESFSKENGLYFISDFVHITPNVDLPSVATNNPALPGDIVTYRDVYPTTTFVPNGIHSTLEGDADSHIREITSSGIGVITGNRVVTINSSFKKIRRIEKFSSATSPPTSLEVKYFDGNVEVINPNIATGSMSFTSSIESFVLSGTGVQFITNESNWVQGPGCEIRISSNQEFTLDDTVTDVNLQSDFYFEGVFTILVGEIPKMPDGNIMQFSSSIDSIANVTPIVEFVEFLNLGVVESFAAISFKNVDTGHLLTSRQFYELFPKPNPVYTISYVGSFNF